jgi:putative hydrolase of the HAD superfamily
MIKGVFFDAGNTLLFPDYEIYRRICSELGSDTTREQVIRAEARARSAFDSVVASSSGAEVHGFWPVYYRPFYELLGIPAESIPEAIERTRVANEQGLGIWSEPVEDLEETLTSLDGRGIEVGIISNSDGRLEWRLDQLGILGRFGFVIDSAVVGVSKPDPRIFREALSRSLLRADEAIYVGDYYEVDVVGARSVGMHPVLLDPAAAYSSLDCDIITRLGGVLDVVDELGDGEEKAKGARAAEARNE